MEWPAEKMLRCAALTMVGQRKTRPLTLSGRLAWSLALSEPDTMGSGCGGCAMHVDTERAAPTVYLRERRAFWSTTVTMKRLPELIDRSSPNFITGTSALVAGSLKHAASQGGFACEALACLGARSVPTAPCRFSAGMFAEHDPATAAGSGEGCQCGLGAYLDLPRAGRAS